MEQYWEPNDTVFQRQRAAQTPSARKPDEESTKAVDDEADAGSDIETEYDRERARLAAEQPQGFDGWRGELREWLKLRDATVTKKTDLCAYWAVRFVLFFSLNSYADRRKIVIIFQQSPASR